jgi:hypothetical protein
VACKVRSFLVHLSCGQGAGLYFPPCANFSVMCNPKTTMRTLTILLFGLTIFSCNQTQTKQDKIVNKDTIAQTTHNTSFNDKITELFDKGITDDTLEFYNQFENNQSFLFFKSGQIISKTEKNAIVVVCPNDTTYTISL